MTSGAGRGGALETESLASSLQALWHHQVLFYEKLYVVTRARGPLFGTDGNFCEQTPWWPLRWDVSRRAAFVTEGLCSCQNIGVVSGAGAPPPPCVSASSLWGLSPPRLNQECTWPRRLQLRPRIRALSKYSEVLGEWR